MTTTKVPTLALIGNPNSGKTALFNAMTGMRHKVGNYPGITVERRVGRWSGGGPPMEVIDLPGTYSLTRRSPDEEVAISVIKGTMAGNDAPDVLVNVCDASNLPRNLYLTTQLLELGVPVVVALTMVDIAESNGMLPDSGALTRELGVPVVPVHALRSEGLEALQSAMAESLAAGPPRSVVEFPRDQEDSWRLEPEVRYAWIDGCMGEFLPRDVPARRTLTDRLDAMLLHRLAGPLFFILIMAMIFQSIFSWAQWPMEQLEGGFGWFGTTIASWMGPGMLQRLLTEGVIPGILNVLVFLPQILLLFFFIGLLEDSGYMARGAVIVDRVMCRVGLHGKSFVPLLSSFACAIPGIMATRTIENRSARLVTILVAPLMSCSARLPVYTLVIGAFFSGGTVLGFLSVAGLVMLGLYLTGIVAAFLMAWLFRRTLVRGDAPTLILELPPYRLPSLPAVLRNMLERARLFVTRVWRVILPLTVIIWFLSWAGADAAIHEKFEARRSVASAEELPTLDAMERRETLRDSVIGDMGRLAEPVFAPLGFDWRINIGVITSFAAREVIVSTLGIVFHGEELEDDQMKLLQDSLKVATDEDGNPAYRPLTGLSLLVFFILACQCMSTLAVTRRETNGWRWPAFMFGYMTLLAWGASFVVFQVGSWMGY